MPIDVSTPDGSSFSFPDGTTQDVITNAMAKHFGMPAAASAAPGVAAAVPEDESSIAAGAGLQGIPIVGAGVKPAEAWLQAIFHPLTGVGEPGESISERAAKNRVKVDERYADFEKRHPILDPLLKVGTGAVALGPVGATALGARALGMGAATLRGAVARGALSGGAINAADAALRGEDVTQAGTIGTALGAGAPLVGRVAGGIAAPIANTVRGIMNPAAEAERRVGTAVGRAQLGIAPGDANAPLTPQAAQAAAAAGQPANVMDTAGELGRALGRSAANTSPEGRATLDRAINQRFEEQQPRLEQWLRSTFHYPDAMAQQTALEQTARTVNNTRYTAARSNPASQAMWDEGFEQIMQSPDVQRAAAKATQTGGNAAAIQGFTPVRRPFEFADLDSLTPRYARRVDAQGREIAPNLEFWDHVKRNMDDQVDTLRRQGQNFHASQVTDLKNALVRHMDDLVPQYAQARAGAAHFFGAENALQAGREFVNSKLANPEARRGLAAMTDTERQLFRDGFVDNLVRSIREMPVRRSVLNTIGNSPAWQERLQIALGPQRANQLQAMLHIEHIMDLARPAIQGNSTTARQLTELGLAGAGGSVIAGGNPWEPAALIDAALLYGAKRGHHRVNERVSRQVAELLASGDHARVARGMQMAGAQNVLGALRSADALLARSASAQLSGPPAPQAPTMH